MMQFVVLLLAFANQAIGAEEQFVFHRPTIAGSSANEPTVTPSGKITLAGDIEIPAFSLTMSSGREVDGKETFDPAGKTLDITVRPEMAAQVYAYAYPMGIILAPKTWQVRSAAVGADGSMYLVFAPDTTGNTYLIYSSAGVCMGCAIEYGSLYFEQAKKMARDDEFPYYRRPSNLKVVSLNKFQKAYSFQVNYGNPVDGLAYFDADNDYEFFDVQVSAAKSSHELAAVLLNQFVLPKK